MHPEVRSSTRWPPGSSGRVGRNIACLPPAQRAGRVKPRAEGRRPMPWVAGRATDSCGLKGRGRGGRNGSARRGRLPRPFRPHTLAARPLTTGNRPVASSLGSDLPAHWAGQPTALSSSTLPRGLVYSKNPPSGCCWSFSFTPCRPASRLSRSGTARAWNKRMSSSW